MSALRPRVIFFYYIALCSQHQSRHSCTTVMKSICLKNMKPWLTESCGNCKCCMFPFVHAHVNRSFLTEWLRYCAAWNISSSPRLWRMNLNISKHGHVCWGRCLADFEDTTVYLFIFSLCHFVFVIIHYFINGGACQFLKELDKNWRLAAQKCSPFV